MIRGDRMMGEGESSDKKNGKIVKGERRGATKVIRGDGDKGRVGKGDK